MHDVLGYQLPLQAVCTVCEHAAPGMQHAPVGTHGLGEHDWPEYHVFAAGQLALVSAVHPPVDAKQHAPVAVGAGQGLVWHAAEPPPRKVSPVPEHAEGVVNWHAPSAARQHAPDWSQTAGHGEPRKNVPLHAVDAGATVHPVPRQHAPDWACAVPAPTIETAIDAMIETRERRQHIARVMGILLMNEHRSRGTTMPRCTPVCDPTRGNG